MVDIEVFNKKSDFLESDLAKLLKVIDSYPNFEMAKVKFVQVASELGLDGPLVHSFNQELETLSEILNYKELELNRGMKTCEGKSLIDGFLRKFELPKSPSVFKDK